MFDTKHTFDSRFIWQCIVVFGFVGLISGRTFAAEPVDYSREIRPILASKCFNCHGADPGPRKGGLRLDLAEGAYQPAKSGSKAVVPGDLNESELYQRIVSHDESDRMPPTKSGKSLNDSEIAKLKRWIEEGGQYKTHWAFVKPVKTDPPSVKETSWVRNPIDSFILAKLEAEGLKPSPEADRTTLIRRLSLDLLGLPPTPTEVDAFLADQSPEAYERVVDRLLASPHYGERWGRIWLDAARYADSDGFEKDKSRQVWFYRDWVINALNADLPYHEFISDQIAGDLKPNASQDQIVATGFLRNSMINEEGGIDPEQFRMEAMFDRMDAIGKGVLGLTIQCAQCHSHKYDPLTQDEYYQLFAFLNNTHEANASVYTPDQLKTRAEVLRSIADIEADLRHRHPDWASKMAAWEAEAVKNQPEWTILQAVVEGESTGGAKYYPLRDGSFLVQGYAPTKSTVEMTVRTDLKGIRAFRIELLNDPNLPQTGPGRSLKGVGALTEFGVTAAPADAVDRRETIKFVKATADVNPPETPLEAIFDDKSGKKRVTGPASFAIDGNGNTSWGIDIGPGLRNVPRKAVFNTEKPIEHSSGTILTFHIKQDAGGWNSDDNQNCNLGRFRLAITTAENAEADPLPSNVRRLLDIPSKDRTEAQTNAIFRYFRTTVAEWKESNDAINALWSKHPEPETQLVLEDRDEPRMTSVLQRGDFLKPSKAVEPGVPAFLNPLPAGVRADRLAFANWLVDRNAPTTARAIVNRTWQAFFGNGLVASSEDLGSQCETPSHPALLDNLAVTFMDDGWRLKTLHKRIVTSATYQQSSKVTPELLSKDPYNRLLARGARFRVDAELVRDIALAASGLLNETIGGPSVFPPAPAFLFQPPTSYGPKVWNESKGGDRYRRALYTFRYRSVPYPVLQTFDAPNGDFACVKRPRSNTPLQALVTLNEPEFLESARGLARKTLTDIKSNDAERLEYAFRRCVARKPTPAEASAMLGLLDRQTKAFETSESKAWEFAANSTSDRPVGLADVSPARLAAWTAVSRVLLNLDETITKE